MKRIKYSFIFLDSQISRGQLYLTPFILILFILSSCTINDLGTEPDIDQKIVGSGNLIYEEIEVPFFHSISINTAGLVNLKQETEQNVKVKVDDNILDYLIIRVQEDVLIIEVVNNVTLADYESYH